MPNNAKKADKKNFPTLQASFNQTSYALNQPSIEFNRVQSTFNQRSMESNQPLINPNHCKAVSQIPFPLQGAMFP
jgi:hypothetical protein